MAKLTAPFFALRARRRLGHEIYFTERNGQPIARKITKPFNPHSTRQEAQRSWFKEILATWHSLTPTEVEAYRLINPRINTNAAYINFMKIWLLGVVPAHEPNHRPGGSDALSQVPDHDHSGGPGDGGQFDFDNLSTKPTGISGGLTHGPTAHSDRQYKVFIPCTGGTGTTAPHEIQVGYPVWRLLATDDAAAAAYFLAPTDISLDAIMPIFWKPSAGAGTFTYTITLRAGGDGEAVNLLSVDSPERSFSISQYIRRFGTVEDNASLPGMNTIAPLDAFAIRITRTATGGTVVNPCIEGFIITITKDQ